MSDYRLLKYYDKGVQHGKEYMRKYVYVISALSFIGGILIGLNIAWWWQYVAR